MTAIHVWDQTTTYSAFAAAPHMADVLNNPAETYTDNGWTLRTHAGGSRNRPTGHPRASAAIAITDPDDTTVVILATVWAVDRVDPVTLAAMVPGAAGAVPNDPHTEPDPDPAAWSHLREAHALGARYDNLTGYATGAVMDWETEWAPHGHSPEFRRAALDAFGVRPSHDHALADKERPDRGLRSIFDAGGWTRLVAALTAGGWTLDQVEWWTGPGHVDHDLATVDGVVHRIGAPDPFRAAEYVLTGLPATACIAAASAGIPAEEAAEIYAADPERAIAAWRTLAALGGTDCPRCR